MAMVIHSFLALAFISRRVVGDVLRLGLNLHSRLLLGQKKEYRPVLKKPTASSSGNKKKGVKPTIEVSNSNPFEVLNLVDNDVELGTNGGTTNLVNNRATSSGSSFMNVDNSSTGTTPIIDQIEKFEELLNDVSLCGCKL
ncbi:hypothetical protein Tco_1023739 [Tanacetum coccineum]